MPKMPTSELKAMLTAEKLDELAAMRASKLSVERALLGKPKEETTFFQEPRSIFSLR
jgi:hypothetical protein